MPRKISVGLDLDAVPYINEAGKVLTTTKAMNAEMGALDREVDKVDRDMAELAVTTEAAKRQVDDLGDKARGSAADLSLLNARIKATKASVRELGLEFARTGDKAAGTNVARERSLLGRLEKLRAELSDLDSAASGVPIVGGAKVRSGAISAPNISPTPIVIGGLVAGVAAALPTIGAMLGGAIAGAAGTGAMAAGILAASHNPRVQDAAGRFGETISGEFFKSGDAFVVPIMDSLDILQRGFADLHLDQALAKVAPTVTVIAQGLADAANNFMPGFNKALDRMGPFAEVAANGLADMGSAFGSFLDDVTASRGSLEGLASLFAFVSGSIRLLGKTIEWLSDRYRDEIKVSRIFLAELEGIALATGNSDLAAYLHGLGVNIDEMVEGLNHAPPAIDGVNQELDPFAGYLQHASTEMDKLRQETEAANKALTDYFNILMSNDEAQLAVNKGMLDFQETLKRNGRHWEDNTKAGLDNRDALLQQIQNLERARETEIALGGDTGQANQKFYAQVEALLKVAGQAGATKKYLDNLEREYVISIVLTGAITAGAQKVINTLSNFFGGGTKPVLHIDTGRPVGERAAGGPVMAGVPYLVGEHGPEIAMFGQNGQVYNHQQSAAMAQQWSGGGSGGGDRYVIENHITLIDPMTGAKTRAMLITDARNRGKPSDVVSAAYP